LLEVVIDVLKFRGQFFGADGFCSVGTVLRKNDDTLWFRRVTVGSTGVLFSDRIASLAE
jgi:hypothetical protein